MDQETARFMLELSEDIDGLWKYLGHDKNAKELREKARDIESKVIGYRKEVEGLIRHQNEESSKYFNTVMAVGYAGYFASWTLTRENLDQWHSSFVGLMGLISLAVFIVWELIMMHFRIATLGDLNRLFQSLVTVEDFVPLRDDQLTREARRMRLWQPIWRLVFLASTGTAAAGAIDMMFQLYLNL